MRKYLLVLILSGIFTACKGHKEIINPPPSPPSVLQKDIAKLSLHSPYYHFEYDFLKRVSFASLASDFTKYDVLYDGGRTNLSDITYHFTPFEGQIESNYTVHYEQNNHKVNVHGFDLTHNEFFDHVFLRSRAQLQKDNLAKDTLTGVYVGDAINCTYTYNDKNAPLTRNDNLVYLTSTRAGQHFNLDSTYSYQQ